MELTRKRNRKFFAIIALIFAFVLTSAILSFSGQNSLNSNAYTAGSAPASIGSLTFSNYATREDGGVIDAAVLDKLYGLILGSNTGKYSDVLTLVQNSTSTTVGSSSDASLRNNVQPHSINFNDIANGNPITIEFGGYEWNVVYLTTNTNANTNASSTGNSGDLIATLWMSDTDAEVGNKPWAGFDSTVSNGTYSSSEYGASRIRIETLNGGDTGNVATQYAISTSAQTTVNAADRVANPYAKFTMTNAALAGDNDKKGTSLVEFLATPSQVNYQIAENWVWSYCAGRPYLLLNEAWGSGTNGVTGPNTNLQHPNGSKGWYGSGNTNNMNQVITHTRYYEWKDDYLWLPSFTETGFYDSSTSYGTSLWGIPNNNELIRYSSSIPWLRSGHESHTNNVHCLRETGGGYGQTVSTAYAVRPALHLNLTKAQAASKYEISLGNTISEVYDGTAKGIEGEAWYNDVKDSVTVEYYDADTQTKLNSAPIVVGNYKANLTIKDGINNIIWSDGLTGKTRSVGIFITPKSIAFPTWFDNDNSEDYAGDGTLYYTLNSYDSSLIDIKVPSNLTNKVTFGNGEATATGLEAGTYTLDVSLTDTKNYQWATSGNKLQFIVAQKTINITDLSDGGNHTLVSSRDSTLALRMKIDINTPVHNGKQVVLNVIASTDGLSKKVGTVTLDQSSRDIPVNLTFTGTPNGRTYRLSFEIDDTQLDGKNYALSQDGFTTTVELKAGVRSMLTWQLQADGADVFGEYTDASVNQTSIAFGGSPIVYDGRHYSFAVWLPDGYTMDNSFGVGGYKVIPGTSNGNGINADSYTTQVRLLSDGNSQIYEITWEIQKAKFDLSNVKWVGDGKIPYTGNTVSAVLKPSALPAGLIPSYAGVYEGKNVGDKGTASVSFTLSGNYINNYILPIQSDASSYIYNSSNGSAFEWDKYWEVVKAVIPIDWQNTTGLDKNGKQFTYPIIKGDQYKNVLTYHFYETDESGNILNPNDYLTINDIEIMDNVRKFYKVKPVFANASQANNYDLQDVYSTYFALGELSEAVEVDLANKSLQYNAKSQAVTINILVGTIGVDLLDIVYYDRNGVAALSDIPTNVGQYRVEISIKQGVTGYYLTGANVNNGTAVIEYEITKRIINNSTWVTSHNPPSLQLTFYELQGVLYEYEDMNGNPLVFSQLKTGNTYKVRALVKDRNNYEFANDFNGDYYTTDWQEFTVSENEQLYDPLDPNNPFYPEDPDNPNPKPGDEEGGSFIDKIKEFFEKLIESHFPLWQVITSCVAILLTLIFMIKAIQYGNRKKKAKGEAKKYNAKTYAAGFLPIFAPNIVWLNLSNMVWSIIAFSLCGVMLLMFLIALITRRGWKKAELAKETAIEESEQRKEAKILEREEAQENRQRELQQTIAQAAQGGQLGDSASIIEEMRREMEERRREDEERHRQEMDAMKLMLANMMGRQQADGDIPYAAINDTDLLVQKVIAGLLPAVQQMLPEATAYLAAPSEENEELKALVEEQKALVEEQRAIVEEQSEEIRNMTAQMTDLQEQLAAMSQERVEGVLLPDQSEEIRVLTERISELQEQLSQDRVEGILLPDQSEEIKSLTSQISELQEQIINMSKTPTEPVVMPEQSEEIKALTAEVAAMREQLALQAAGSIVINTVENDDDDLDDDEEEWDSILDEDDDDFVEAVIIEEDGTVKKTYPNFRMRLKQSSDKNREWYAAVKNLFCSQKGVTYRVYKRVEKIRYQGQVIAVIGIAKRSIKLWLALKPYEYDARRYHHKDVSDKPRFVDVPMYVRVSSDRALTRAQELILALFQELNMEARKRYNDRSIQELIFTLKHNKLLTNKQNKGLLCEVMHVHDCDVLSDELAEKCIESKNVESIDESYIETLKLDDIDAKFQDGNRVTLEKLKKAGLVSEECTGYAVTAGHRLTKPLIIVANDFTLPAVKMITLTGGRAIKLTKV